MLYQLEDGSIHNDAGFLVYMSTDRFLDSIVSGDCCFICGRAPSKTDFNKEHILSNWILNRYKLHSKYIDLPNATGHSYGSYTIPCCVNCNGLMNTIFEIPIREYVLKGYSHIKTALHRDGPLRFFVWLALIFLKTHLKDSRIPLHRDKRKGSGNISDAYAWNELHHLHCVARMFFTMCDLDPATLGTVYLAPALCDTGIEPFDYADNLEAQTVMIRLDCIALIAVLNDCNATGSILEADLMKLPGPFEPLELRELFVHFTNVNLQIINRPKFMTHADGRLGRLAIRAENIPSDWETRLFDQTQFATLMNRYCYMTKSVEGQKHDPELLKQGKITFLKEPEGGYKYMKYQKWPNRFNSR
ncbi:MAG: hypothetical protein JNJ77_11305 [Planctomycetia bacterium]|nr:hypothetical protein [Planctomycetia bacterium]